VVRQIDIELILPGESDHPLEELGAAAARTTPAPSSEPPDRDIDRPWY
jgi:hypothetical protein